MQTGFGTPNWKGDINRKHFNLQKQSLMSSLKDEYKEESNIYLIFAL